MKLTKRVLAMLLAMMMVLTFIPLSAFATETVTGLVYESEIYEDETLNGYKQYETMWTDSTHVKADVKISVYFDTENVTQTRDVIFYVINWNGERIGTDSDVDIVTDTVEAAASVESGNRAAVIVADFGGNTLAVAGTIEASLAALREELPGQQKITVWSDPAAAMASDDPSTAETTTVAVHKNHVYVLPAGYRVARDLLYFETDFHSSLGTMNNVMTTWNTQVAYNPDSTTATGRYAKGKLPEVVSYAWHTGDESCTCTANGATNECFAGAPQEKNGEVIACTKKITHTGDKSTCEYPHSVLTTVGCTSGKTANVNWAPVVSRVEDCRRPDGSPMEYHCRLDIIYPSGADVEQTPVFVQAATQSPRMTNIGTSGRTALIGMTFNGYTTAVYDYAYIPMARGDHFGYIDGYGFHGYNGAKVARAAIRCIRYHAEELGYNDDLIGVAGISKGTPTTGILSTVDNKYVQEVNSYTYTVNGTEVQTRGLYYEGDLEADGSVTAGKTVQPYMTYENGYDGINDGDYKGERTGEISSEVSVVYCAAGDGINWVYGGAGNNASIMLGASYTYTDENGEEQTRITQHVPMVLSCGYNDQYGCWNHWEGIQARFTKYAANPFLAISMEDMGHDYPAGIDPIRDYDRYDAFNQFFHSILKPEIYEAKVAWTMPQDGKKDVSLDETLQVQLITPTDRIDDVTVTDNYGNELEGTWTTNANNTSGLYTFVPSSGWLGGTEYTVTFPTTVVSTETERSFTTEAGGVLRPVADTFVSAADADAVYGAAQTLTVNNQNFYVASFLTADFGDSNKATLNLPLSGSASQELSVYVVDNYKIDEATFCYNDMPTLTDKMLVGKYTVSAGKNALNLKDIVDRVSGENFTLIIVGSANSLDLDFEEYSEDGKILSWNNYKTEGTFEGSPNRPASDDDCFSDYYVGREAGSMPDMYAKADPADSGNMTASFISSQTYNRMKFFNSFVRDKSYLTEEDLGKVFDISYRVRVDVNGVASPTLQISHGIVEANTTNIKDSLTTKLTADTWTTVTDTITITQEMLDIKAGMLVLNFSTSPKGVRYYIDDITVTERAPSTLVSRENTSAMTAYITTETLPEGQPYADAYVSALAPDTAFGKDGKLMISGGDDEHIVLLTFPSSVVDGKNYLDLKLPIENDAGVEVDIYLLDGYYVDEDVLTYNNMPDLSGKTPIGTYTIKKGSTVIELEGVEAIKEACFTLVLKSTDTSCHYYYMDFEDWAEGDKPKNTSATETKTETVDGVETDVLYAYGYSDSAFFRGGSNWGTNSLTIAVDPHDADNLTLLGATSGGRARLMNALSHDDLTEADLDKTYRFSFKVKDADATAGSIQYGIMEANGYSKYYSRNYVYTSDANPVTNEGWREVTIDFNLSEVLGTAGVTAPKQPMIYIESAAYYYDDLCVIELNDDGTEKRAILRSNEGADNASETVSFRTRTVYDPIADTYVSAIDAEVAPKTEKAKPDTDKNANFGQRSELYISGASSQVGERVTLLGYRSEAVADGDVIILNLPTANDTSAKINIYLLDGYRLDEDAMTYALYESEVKSKMVLVGSATLTKGANKIELDAKGKVNSDYFTLILCAADTQDHIYVSDFEKWEAGTHGNSSNQDSSYTSYFFGYDSNGFKSNEGGDFIGYSSKNFYVRGSNSSYGYMSVLNDPDGSDNKVLEYKIGANSPRVKLVNTLSFDELTEADVGKTYRFSFRIKAITENGSILTKSNTMGALRMYGSSYESNTAATNNSSSVKVTTNGEWHEFTYDYVVDSNDITATADVTTAHNDPVFTIVFAGESSTVIHYYLDDITVVKLDENGCEPVVTIASAEAENDGTLLPTVGAQNSLVPVADSYVSRVNPDTVYGNEATLKLGDADGDKKVMVLSFMNKALDEGNYVQLSLPNSGKTIKNVSVYYVTDYCVDESALTWNTMPDYLDNLLGTYDLEAGENKIDVSALRGKLSGDYFTLVFRTESHSFGMNFENFDSNQTFSDNKDNNVVDTTDSSISHYHGFYTEELLEKYGWAYALARRGGIVDNRKIAVDPDDPDNQVFALSTSVKQTYGGRLKFYNTMSYEAMTADDVGKTYRFTVRVRAAEGNDESVLSKLKIVASAMSSYGSTNFSSTDTATAQELQAGWVTLSVDYTVRAQDVAFLMNSDTVYAYPMFAVDLGADGSSTLANYYLLDDIKVEEIVDGKLVGETTFAAREEAEDIRFVSMLNGNVTILENTVSDETVGDVFNIVDDGKTHTLLSVEDGKLVFGDYTLCDGKGEVYVLGETPVKVSAIYDDTNGTVRFTVGDKIAYYEAKKATFGHVMISGGVGDNAFFGVAGITATKMESIGSELIGYQKNETNDTSIRFLSGVDTLYYTAIGFAVERDGVKLNKESDSPYVFTAVNAGGNTAYASDYGYNYMTALIVDGITSGGVLKVTPYVKVGDNVIEGEPSYYKITTNGGLSLVKTTADAVDSVTNADLAALRWTARPWSASMPM